MKYHFKLIFSLVLTFQMMWAPVFAAPIANDNTGPAHNRSSANNNIQYQTTATSNTYDQQSSGIVSNQNENVLMEFKDPADGKTKQIYLSAEDAAKLKAARPSRIRRDFKAEKAAVIAAHKQSYSSVLLRFPKESALFFAAIGFVMMGQLTMDYSSNPLAMQQHIESVKDPLANVSFLMFMLANTATTNGMLRAGLDPRAKFFKYIGNSFSMAVGMFASNLTNDLWALATDTNVKTCARGLAGLKKDGTGAASADEVAKQQMKIDEACDTAYMTWAETRKIIDYTSGMISLIASAAINGGLIMAGKNLLASEVIQEAKKQAQQKVLKMVGVELATLLIPVGGEVNIVFKSARWVVRFIELSNSVAGQLINFATFTAVDMIIHPYISSPMNNMGQGFMLSRSSDKLSQQIADVKAKGWYEEPDQKVCRTAPGHAGVSQTCTTKLTLDQNLRYFSLDLKNWRNFNLEKVNMAYGNWATYLTQLQANYASAQNFYRTIVEEAQIRQFPQDDYYTSPLDIIYYLNGIIPKGVSPEQGNLYFEQPVYVKSIQIATAKDVAQQMQTTWVNDIASVTKKFPKQAAVLKQIQELLATGAPSKIAQAVTMLNAKLVEFRPGGRIVDQNLYECFRLFYKIKSTLGTDALPADQAGQGYIYSYDQNPAFKQIQQGAVVPGHTGIFVTKNPTSHYLVQMICGPNAENYDNLIVPAKVLGIHTGMDTAFAPPSIVEKPKNYEDICKMWSISPFHSEETAIYTQPVVGRNGKTYVGLLSYIKDNIKPNILGNANGLAFDAWWAKYVDNQLQEAFANFRQEYMPIVVKLIEILKNNKSSMLNFGPAANGTIASIRQEQKMYIEILGEILRDLITQQDPQALNNLLAGPKATVKQDILKYNFDDNQTLAVQVELAQAAEQVFALFDKLHVNYKANTRTIVGRGGVTPTQQTTQTAESVTSDLTAKEISDKLQRFNEIAKLISSSLQSDGSSSSVLLTPTQAKASADSDDQGSDPSGEEVEPTNSNQAANTPSFPQLKVTPYQAKLISKILERLQANMEELASFANIANTADYSKIGDTSSASSQSETNARCAGVSTPMGLMGRGSASGCK